MSKEPRERWGSRLGLILAVAGNAVGLGNFLRFPVQAAENGGGAFMIPYFTAFILLGIPLMWCEWAIGRRGGAFGHSSAPGFFDVLWKNRAAKYIGALGLWVSLTILIYYCYIESWTLGYSIFSAIGLYFDETTFGMMREFLQSYQGLAEGHHFTSMLPAYLLMTLTLAINFWVLSKGISAGIEKLAKIAMPLLFIFALVLLVRVFTLDTPDPANPDYSVWSGMAWLWNPDFSQLSNAKIWLAAAGQVFFTLSLGMGTIHAYASYLRPKDDIALSGLATASTNEFTEVIFGGSIAIPVAVAFFGIEGTRQIAAGGAFDLGFVSMPIIFTKIPGGPLFGTLWFLLLFFAGITSSVAMAQPVIAFLRDEFGMSRKKATWTLGALTFLCIQPVVFFLGHGFLDEMDFWAGTFGLAVFALIEVIIFAWVFGMDNAWEEITRAAEIRVPRSFKYIIKYVTPLYLLFVFVMWGYQDALPTLLMHDVALKDAYYIHGARLLMTLVFIALLVMVAVAWKRNRPSKA